MNKIWKADLKTVRGTSITMTKFFNLQSPWFSHVPIPKHCLEYIILYPKKWTNCKNSLCALCSPSQVRQNKKWKGSSLFFLKDFWCGRVECCSLNHYQDSFHQSRQEMQVPCLPDRKTQFYNFSFGFLGTTLTPTSQCGICKRYIQTLLIKLPHHLVKSAKIPERQDSCIVGASFPNLIGGKCKIWPATRKNGWAVQINNWSPG